MQSYTKAAQALNLTQPAITQHIARLEEILGFRLIERSRGVVLPTPESQALLPDLERFERSTGLIFEKARAISQGGRQTIQIATPTSLVTYLLAPTVAQMRKAKTEIFPIFREVDDHRVYDMVRAGEVEFALTSMTGNDNGLSCTFLLSDRPCLVYPDGHPIGGDGPIDIEEILTFELIRPPTNTSANRMISIFERMSGREFSFSAEASRLMTMEVMARAGLGLLILPALSAKLSSHSGLSFRPINTHKGWRNCQLIRQLHAKPSPLAKQVIDGVRAKVRKLEENIPELLSQKMQHDHEDDA